MSAINYQLKTTIYSVSVAMAAAATTVPRPGRGVGATLGAGRAGAAGDGGERAEELFHVVTAAVLTGRFFAGARQGLEALAAFLASVFVQWHWEIPC